MRTLLKGVALTVAVLFSFAMVLGPVSQAEAADSAGGKFGRGLVNVATGWLEIFHNIWEVSQEENPLLGITVGTIKGVGKTIARMGSGVFDLLTFYLEPYDEPLVSPDYVWSE